MWKFLIAAALCQYCVLAASDIPKQCKDPNATTGCGVNCGRHCSDVFYPSKGPRPCSDICIVGGCDCKPGYYQDNQQNGKCVTAEQCIKPKCPPNEEFKFCPPSCPPKTCATKDIQVKCKAPLVYPDPKCPKPACQCKEGFYRNSDGNCVTKKQCSKYKNKNVNSTTTKKS